MKKAIMIILVLSLAVCFSACTGGGDVITYTGDYVEDSSTTSGSAITPEDLNSTSSTTAPSTESNTATTVLIPLTTVPGGTVPTIHTTAPSTEFSTVDYTPLDISTTKPPVYTTYVNPQNNYVPTQSQQSGNNNSNNEEPTTAKKTTYVSVSSGDTILDVDSETGIITLYVWGDDFGLKMKKTTGSDAVINVNGEQQLSASYTVSETMSDDGWVVVTVEPRGSVSFIDEDVVTVTMPKGALMSTKSVSNNKFTSIIGSVI